MTLNKKTLILSICVLCLVALIAAFYKPGKVNAKPIDRDQLLGDSISQIVSSYPGEIGVALIIDNADTITVNNSSIYPMMSVFKLHQALAICHDFDRKGLSLDTMISIRRNALDPDTWSPMLKDHAEASFSLPVKDLLRYTLVQSDNNASNLMFKMLVGVEETDNYIATLISRQDFQIAYSEEDMSADHAKAYDNYTSPLGAAMLINRLFTDSIVSSEKQAFIIKTLKECKTGTDRIVAPLQGKDGIVVAHKTGSGYTNTEGILVAHNDVAYVTLPDSTSYALAVFVKDFKGKETEASRAIARISEAIYSILNTSQSK